MNHMDDIDRMDGWPQRRAAQRPRITASEWLYAWTDQDCEEAVIARWRAVIEAENNPGQCKVLSVRNVPNAPTRIVVDGEVWEVRAVDPSESIEVPPSIAGRLDRFDAARMPWSHFILGEEIFRRPRTYASADLSQERAQRMGESHAPTRAPTRPDLESGYPTYLDRREHLVRPQAAPQQPLSQPTWWKRFLAALEDPILVWVIPTSANRGWWVQVGAWFYQEAMHH